MSNILIYDLSATVCDIASTEAEGGTCENGTCNTTPCSLNDDNVSLRRAINKLIADVDELKGFRGDNNLARADDLQVLAGTIRQVNLDLQNLNSLYVRLDGAYPINSPLSYSAVFTLTGQDLIDVNTVDDKINNLSTVYVSQASQPAPALLNGDTVASNMSAKIDEIINILQSADVLS